MEKKNKQYVIPLMLFHVLSTSESVLHGERSAYSQSYLAVVLRQRELDLQCLHQWLSHLHWCFFFLIVLLELSHVTLISKFSHFSLMSFLKIHLSAIDSRLKTPHVLSKAIIIIEQLKIQEFYCCFMNSTLRHLWISFYQLRFLPQFLNGKSDSKYR